MKTLKLILMTVFLSSIFGHAMAQDKTIDLLKSVKWQQQFERANNSYDIYLEFSANQLVSTFVNGGKSDESIEIYYLSDNTDAAFKTNQVGKISQGEYIISKLASKSTAEIWIVKILYLDKNKLVTQLITKDGKENTPNTYLAVPK